MQIEMTEKIKRNFSITAGRAGEAAAAGTQEREREQAQPEDEQVQVE